MADALIERALGCDDDVARNKAIRLVRKLGDVSAQGLLLQRVADPLETPGNVDAAVEELSRIGPAAIGEVAKRARQQNPRHAVVTLHALTRWTAGCQSALPLYVEWAEDHDAPQELRCAALFCIARLGTDARSAAPQVRELLNHAPPGRIRAAALVALDALGALSAQELASAQASPIPELAIAADSIAAAAGNTLAVDRLVVRLRGPHWPMAAGALEDLGAKSLPGLKSAVFNSDLPDDLRLAALEVGLRTADTPLQTWGAVLHDPRIGDPSLWLFDAQLDTDRRVALVQYLTEASYRSSEAAFLGQLERLASQLSGPMGGGAGEGPLPSPSRLAAALMDLESFTHPWTAGMLPLPRAEESASPDAASEPPSDARTPTPPLIDPADPRRPSESASVSPVPTTRGDTERSPRSVEPPSLDVPDSWPPGAASEAAPSAVPLAVAPPASAAPPKFSRPEFPIEPRSGGAPAMLHNDRPADAQVAEPPDAPESEGRRAPGALVRVFYGTNRRPSAIANASPVRVEAVGVGFVLVYLGLAALFAILMLWNRVRMIAFVAMLLSLGLFAHRIESARFQPANSPPTENTGRTWYAADPSDELRLGVCQVSIPPVHRTGVVERPSVLRFQFRENPTQHVVIHEVREVDQERFFAELRDDARQRGGGVLVFIHGYNVRFDDAIMRTAQLAYDLDYSGTPVTFSWPSCGDWYKYQVDRRNIELSVPMIRRFLEDLARRSGARSIDVIAHSMGNVGLTQALVELSDTQPTPINNVVLAAPDIDAEVFETRIAPRLAGKARRFTLYTSNSDLALRASRYFNAGPRLGEALRPQPQYPGIEVIDATGFDTSLLGHSYYGSHAGILRDLYGLLRGEPIQQRSDVRVARTGDGTYRYIVRDASQASVAAPQVLQ